MKLRVMNRKDKLKTTSTPDQKIFSRNVFQETNKFTEDNFEDVEYYLGSQDDSLFNEQNNLSANLLQTVKKFCKYFRYIFPYSIVLYFIIINFYSTDKTTDFNAEISELTKKVNSIKKENEKTEKLFIAKPHNLCKLELSTTVHVKKEDLYMYGLLGMRRSNDPHVIFGNSPIPGNCLAFLPDEREFVIKFQKTVLINNFHIFHPETNNKKSAVKDFTLRGFYDNKEFEIGYFTYNIHKLNCQSFEFPKILTDELRIRILNNNGHKLYTTIYKIYVIGIYK